jgi:hypothetical protein
MSGTMDHLNLTLKLDAKNLQAFGLATADDPVLVSLLFALAAGTGANQISQQWHSAARVLTASSSETLDVQAGTLKNAFGTVLAFTKIKVVYVKAAAVNTNDVLVGGQGANSWIGAFNTTTSVLKVKPGGVFLWIAPDVNGGAVAAGDLLKVANSSSGTSVTYDVYFGGTD